MFLRDMAACHRGLGPARRDRVHPCERVPADDFVLETEQKAPEDRGLRGRIVGVSRFADDSRRRADQDQGTVTFELAEEATSCQEGRGQVRVERGAPPFEWEVPHWDVVRGPDPCNGGADV